MDMVLRLIVGHIFLPPFARWTNGSSGAPGSVLNRWLLHSTLAALALLLSAPGLATAQADLPERYYFPLIGGATTSAPDALAPQEGAGSAAEATQLQTLTTLQGILHVADDGSLRIADPWGHSHRIVGQSAMGGYEGQFVILTGRRLDDAAGSVFITQSARKLNVEPTRYAAYVRREMSDPALRGSSSSPSQGEAGRGSSSSPSLGEAGRESNASSPSKGRLGGGTNSQPQHLGEPEGATAAAIQASPAEEGEWSPVQDIGMYALHAVLRPDGKVMFWYRTIITNADDPIFNTVIWDPVTKAVTSVPNTSLNGDENWCAAHSSLGDGRLFAVTGDVGAADPHADILDYSTNLWTKIPDLAFGRYYPSTTFMADGRVVVAGGDFINPDTGNVDNPFPEVWEDGAWRTFDEPLPIEPTEIEFDFYYGSFFPWTQQTPDGRIFYAGPQSTLRYMDPDDGGTVTDVAERDGQSRDYGSYATYDIGKVLIAGGGDSLSSAYTIDYNPSFFGDNSPTVRQTGSMNVGRRHLYTTILADGTVLATGGNKGGGVTQASAGGVVKMAELWDPETDEWTEMASMTERREYHSAAVLLPDARVVHAGGDCTPCDPQTNLEIFSPPYLYNEDGSEATRPTISSAPAEIDYGEQFRVTFGSASSIAEVNLIRLGSATHSTNFDQRLIPLTYSSSGSTLSLTGPKNAFIAPPGYYMLFLISNEGVPSLAKIVKVGKHIEPLTSAYGLVNGGFEGGTPAFEENLVFYDTGETIGSGLETGWTVESGNVDVHHNSYLDAGAGAGGNQHLDIHGTEAGQISQPIRGLAVGEPYVLAFRYSVHPLTPWAAVTVEIDGQDYFLLKEGADAHEWQTARIDFTASSADTVLRFRGHEGLTYAGMLIDEVSLEAFDDDGPLPDTGRAPVQLALGQAATQSSLFAGSPGLAVDGNTSGSGQANQVARTNQEIEPWWQVDLGAVQAIDHVVLWPQTDCCAEPLSNFYIFYSESDLTGRTLTDILEDSSVLRSYVATPVEEPLTKIMRGNGRYVRIHSAIPTDLSLAEVEVFSPPPPNREPALSGPPSHLAQLDGYSEFQLQASDPDGHLLAYGVDGLPSGLSVDPFTGIISGTLSSPGLYTFTATVYDPYGGSDAMQIDWSVNQPPTIVDPGTQTPTLGQAITVPIAIADFDGDEVDATVTGLPAGLTVLSNAPIVSATLEAPLTLWITGTVPATATVTGTQWITVSAFDDRGGTATLGFELIVNQPPLLGSPGDQFSNPQAPVYLLMDGADPDGDGLTYSAAGLPDGLEMLPQFGLITGTATTSGLYTVTVTAQDEVGGVGSVGFFWRVNSPPLLSALPQQNYALGETVSLQLLGSDADDDSLLYHAEGLPLGLTLGATAGLIEGQPTKTGGYTSTVTVVDAHGLEASITLSWIISDEPNQPPLLTQPSAQNHAVGDSVTLPLVATDPEEAPLLFGAAGLPDALTLDPQSGLIEGMLVSAGVYTVTVTVDDQQGGLVSAEFVWVVNEAQGQDDPENAAPTLVNPGTAINGEANNRVLNNRVGETIELAMEADDVDGDTLNFSAVGLPGGLNLNPDSGEIRGVILMPGDYDVAVTVTDPGGRSATVSFRWIVDEAQGQVDPENPDPVDGENGDNYKVYVPMVR